MPGDRYLQELNEAYQHFFFHYSASSLLVVETAQFDPAGTDESIDDLIRQIETMAGGTQSLTCPEPGRPDPASRPTHYKSICCADHA